MSSQRTLKVEFTDPQHRWLEIRVTAGPVGFSQQVSYTPYDSLLTLISGLATLLPSRCGECSARVTWNSEPVEFDFCFRREGRGVTLKIYRFPDAKRSLGFERLVLGSSGSFGQVCRPFWKALQDLETRRAANEFEVGWRRPFPSEAMRRLTHAVKS